jgi:PKD repeat protein
MPLPLLQNVYVTALGLNAPNINYPVNLLSDIGVYMGQYTVGFSNYDRMTYIHCYNWSFYVANPIVTFQHDVLMQNPIFTPTPTSYNAATRTAVWNITNLPPNGHRVFWIETTAPTNTPPLSMITADVSISNLGPDAYPQDNQDTIICYVGPNTGYSYDPNYKEVAPQGQTQYGFVSPSTQKLDYTIHFQNTGTAPAQYVVVKDTIEVNSLQINSIEMQMSSHPCSVSVAEDSILIFTFPNINLPDSATDEPNSHGFVKFAMNLLPNLPLNTQISNSSSIYFDFNAPVLTNSTLTTLYKNMELVVNDSISICPTDSILANVQFGKPPYTFSWSNGLQQAGNFSGISKVVANFANGTQSVWVTDAFGMGATQNFQLNLLPVAANVDFSFSTNGNYYFFTPNLVNYSAYLWDFGNGQTSSLENPFTTYTQSGTYEVKLIIWDDCGGVDTLIKEVVFVASENLNAAFVEHIRLQPNPFEEVCTLSFENREGKSYELIIRDLSGKLVQKIDNIRTSEVKIYKENKAKGAYLWELKGENVARGILMVE